MKKSSKSIQRSSSRSSKGGSGSQYHCVTPEVAYRLDSFFEVVGPGEFREQLIELFHSYLRHERRSLPKNFEELTESMVLFMDILKFAEKRWENSVITPEFHMI